MSILLNDDNFQSSKGKTKHEIWLELANLLSSNAETVSSLPVDPIIRSGIAKYTDETGRLWCALASYYIRCAEFERARDIYEEAIQTVSTVRDFGTIFEAYTQFFQDLIQIQMKQEEEEEEGEEEEDDDDDLDPDAPSIDMKLDQLQYLIDRRPLLLSSVVLRQNPNNVEEWHKRVKLFENDPLKVAACYTEAVKTVDTQKATGKPQTLWIEFAKFYESNDDLDSANLIFERATKQNYKKVDHLAEVYCSWAEMLIRHEEYDRALSLMKDAVKEPNQHELSIIKQKHEQYFYYILEFQ